MKAGWLTSEFLLAATVVICATILLALDKDISGAWASAVGAATAAYSLSRGAAKFNTPKDPVPDSPID